MGGCTALGATHALSCMLIRASGLSYWPWELGEEKKKTLKKEKESFMGRG